MAYETTRSRDSAPDRQTVIAEAYREIARRPVYLATVTTGCNFWSSNPEEILEICILESDGGMLFKSLVKPRGSISFYSYEVHRITQRMVKHAPTWERVLPSVNSLLTGRRVGIYDAARQLRFLRQTNALYHLPWTLDEQKCFCVKRLYARFNGKVYADGFESSWLGLGRAARNFGIPHGKWHRAHEDAQIMRAVLKRIASAYVVAPPRASLPRVSFVEKWLARWFER